ncbi:precorrin-6y C5,15-methyltransferase (decarboxylating) subunit CbiE [Microtetraspora sp. NBRC 16547]|uniref:precorrin-6y C5,15-methyltransferase (decarboxylating) subunit CbiE n=1 Tax=Microtetraspora sp. NBRC 16547 TaxID=3030993 RepID=UPI00249FB4F0|nr:precorrin-6y C5,15-methyltransferase (decarboxylating) subunit CbiE [Microtetraspora sp. NBRC 16547]GLW99130.1 precorrin-6Y C(5,15)-methyltransferase [decarboxylating] [Microtetraspora sp. NBRC 16547]
MSEPSGRITVVGVGTDGWSGLGPAARDALRAAEVLMGSARQLDLVPKTDAERVTWPSPLLPALPGLLSERRGRAVCVLASGDPLFFGIGSSLVRLLGADRVRVIPHLSSLSLACARMGWTVQETEVVSLVGRPDELLHPAVLPGRRVLVLVAGRAAPARVAALLAGRGYGRSPMTVLSDLGGPDESRNSGTAERWHHTDPSELNVIAVECRADPGVTPLPRVPGLPDDAFEHDGQLTKREVRAVTMSRLAPVPGELLWDVGAGAGSIAIEWMRSHPACRAIAVESRRERAERATRNAAALGVPDLRIVVGAAPDALAGLAVPDAVFVGGGATAPGVLDACWAALRPGGRLVVNAVTLESEAVVTGWYGRLGGDLVRLAVNRAAPVGGFTGWRAMMPVTVWSVVKPVAQPDAGPGEEERS